jgi:ATP-dependent RNA helicase DDX56/DBP9
MKRKLDQNGVPSPEPENQKRTKSASSADAELSFADLGLDPRLVQAIAEQNFLKPTLVQRKAVPLALNGKDVLCKSKTGSGKTAAYVLPVLTAILKRKNVSFPKLRTSGAYVQTLPDTHLDRNCRCHDRLDIGSNTRTCRPSLQSH